MNRFIIERMSQITVHRGGNVGGVAGRIADGSIKDDLREAKKWCDAAIKVLRSAPDATFASDEESAAYIMAGLDKRKAEQKKARGW